MEGMGVEGGRDRSGGMGGVGGREWTVGGEGWMVWEGRGVEGGQRPVAPAWMSSGGWFSTMAACQNHLEL